MLCSSKEIVGFEVAGPDGSIGTVRDLYFEDERWAIRHLVVATGGWLRGREVLVSPHAVDRLDLERRRVEVRLTREQVEHAPGIETALPVSRQQEIAHHDYYGYPYYWVGAGLWGAAAFPLPVGEIGRPVPVPERGARAEAVERARAAADDAEGPQLRSAVEVAGYRVEAIDGSAGQLDELLFDARSWAVRQAVVDTRTWWPGGQVVVDVASIDAIDWNGRAVRLNKSREALQSAPPFERDRAAP